MRTFLAVRPPAPALAHLRGVLPGWPSAPERWHVTVVFLGDVPHVDDLRGALGEVCAASPVLSLRLAGSGTFGRAGPVWVGVGGDVAALSLLAGGLASACRAAGVDVERRPFRPHLTVGRRGRPDPALLASYVGPAWSATEVEVVESRLGREVEHRVRARLSLAPDG